MLYYLGPYLHRSAWGESALNVKRKSLLGAMTLSIMTLSIMILSITKKCDTQQNATQHNGIVYAVSFMLTVVNKLFMMNVIMVIMMSVVMLCVVAPLIIQVPPPLCWEGSKHFLQILDYNRWVL